MYFLVYEGICADPNLTPLWNVVGVLVNVIWIGIPIALVVLGSIDLGKAVIASKEDEVKKAWKAFGRRFLYAVGVFLVVWVVKFALTTVTNIAGENTTDYSEDKWTTCWCRITNGSNADGTCKTSK